MGLTPDMWIALSILAVAILLFVTEWLRVDVVALCVVVALALSGLIGPEEAVSGCSTGATQGSPSTALLLSLNSVHTFFWL